MRRNFRRNKNQHNFSFETMGKGGGKAGKERKERQISSYRVKWKLITHNTPLNSNKIYVVIYERHISSVLAGYVRVCVYMCVYVNEFQIFYHAENYTAVCIKFIRESTWIFSCLVCMIPYSLRYAAPNLYPFNDLSLQ